MKAAKTVIFIHITPLNMEFNTNQFSIKTYFVEKFKDSKSVLLLSI